MTAGSPPRRRDPDEQVFERPLDWAVATFRHAYGDEAVHLVDAADGSIACYLTWCPRCYGPLRVGEREPDRSLELRCYWRGCDPRAVKVALWELAAGHLPALTGEAA